MILGMLNVRSLVSGSITVRVTYTDETGATVTETIAKGKSKGKFPIAYWIWNMARTNVTVSVAGPFSGNYDLDISPLDMF
jgi:hypothetical protein